MKPIHETAQPGSDTTSDRTTHKVHVRTHLLSRLAALFGVLALGLLYLLLPAKLIIGPNWLLLVIEAAAILPVAVVSLTMQRQLSHTMIRTLALALLGILTLSLAIGITLLVLTLQNEKGNFLLRSAGILWTFNLLVFALWYFEIDGGGPLKRHIVGPQATDFLFPQYASGNSSNWMPHFVDYIFLAFTSATALSPADTQPLTRTAKILMMIEAVFSVVIIVLLAARAVNILG
ncbi:MAG TPA: hypothetical protein VNE38_10840 [Ktedonobacteraceae bacterium]|nr:hypothetical protein [Ktedonobacteraceae bacterium]